MIIDFIDQKPFLFFAMIGAAALIYIYFNAKISENLKVVVFNIAFIMLIFGFIEAACIFKDNLYDVKETGHLLCEPDSVRGYCPKSDQRSPSKRLRYGKVLYDVVYTTDHFGLRVAPHDLRSARVDPNARRALFFGCSFTFGVGVNDNETIPFIFEKNSHGKYLAYNFGIPGGGPHQMLALLESEVPDHVLAGQKPVAAVYQALPCHIERASFKSYGLGSYANSGPRYFLDPSNRYLLKKKEGTPSLSMFDILSKSAFLRDSLLRSVIIRTEANRKLFVAIVKRSKEIFEHKYGGKFYVIYWDWVDRDDQVTIEDLRREGIQVIPVSNILKGYREHDEKYSLKEGHPNPLAYQTIAQYLLNENL